MTGRLVGKEAETEGNVSSGMVVPKHRMDVETDHVGVGEGLIAF